MKPFDHHPMQMRPKICEDLGCIRASQLNLFPTPVFYYQLKDHSVCDQIVPSVKNYFKGPDLGYHLCQSTKDDLHTKSEFKYLKDLLARFVENTINVLNIVTTEFEFLGMWANSVKSAGYMSPHQHPNSFLSGVLYLQIPEGDKANIFFHDPNNAKSMWAFDTYPDHKSLFESRNWEFEPEKGMLLLFPSWLYHGVKPARWDGDEERIALSFNILPKFKCSRSSMRIN